MIQPMHDNVVVKRDKAEEKKTHGGVLLPAKNNSTPDTATVIAIGPRCGLPSSFTVKDLPPDVTFKVGDKVLIGRYSGTDLTEDGVETVTVIPWKDILGVVR
jgi:chaperonin GroES